MAKDSLLIYSGGLDSTTMLYEFRESIAVAVNFSYGANHNQLERNCARHHCSLLDIQLIEIPLDFIKNFFESSLLRGAEAVPKDDYRLENLKSTVVPFRNGIMLSIAAGIAESQNLRNIMIANHGGDHSVYPDCRPEFIAPMSEAICNGTYARIKLIAPYTDLDKTDIALRAIRLGIDLDKTYSCYCGSQPPCGSCATCRERDRAIESARRIINNEK